MSFDVSISQYSLKLQACTFFVFDAYRAKYHCITFICTRENGNEYNIITNKDMLKRNGQ